jgi:pSer/pThr/pTyr-binding forkhead associated (FHA) protein
MPDSPIGLHQSTAPELRDRLAAERRGDPFLLYRDGDGAQRLVPLNTDQPRITVGRSPDCDVCLAWDVKVSRLHAELECRGTHWLLTDDGLSSNGTFLHGERVAGRRRLADHDVLRVGATSILFRRPGDHSPVTTRLSDEPEMAAAVTDAQRRVVVVLCRPFKNNPTDAEPATNPQIAAELHLTVGAVKSHLRAVAHSFGIEDLPQQQKRRRLVALAFASGLVSDRDL